MNEKSWSKSDVIAALGLAITLLVIVSGSIGIVTMLQADAAATKRSIDEMKTLMREYEQRKELKLERLSDKLNALELELAQLKKQPK